MTRTVRKTHSLVFVGMLRKEKSVRNGHNVVSIRMFLSLWWHGNSLLLYFCFLLLNSSCMYSKFYMFCLYVAWYHFLLEFDDLYFLYILN